VTITSCPQCQNKVEKGAKYCTNCGKGLSGNHLNPSNRPTVPLMSEKVLGIIPVYRSTWTTVQNVVLYFTLDKTIVTHPLASARTHSSEAALFGVAGILIDAAARAAVRAIRNKKEERKIEKPLEISVEEILKVNKNNYMIPNSDVTRVELKIATRHLRKGFAHVSLNFKTNKKYGKTEWHVQKNDKDGISRAREIENLLRSIFGDRLSVIMRS